MALNSARYKNQGAVFGLDGPEYMERGDTGPADPVRPRREGLGDPRGVPRGVPRADGDAMGLPDLAPRGVCPVRVGCWKMSERRESLR